MLGADCLWRGALVTRTIDGLSRHFSGADHERPYDPEQVRSKIDHPIVDGDGHWVEYDPVFSEKMRKVGGDLAADGFLKSMAVTRDSLAMSVAERRQKRIGQSAFWSRQAENTLDPRHRDDAEAPL